MRNIFLISNFKLTFGELEASSCTGTAVLFTLYHTGVASKIAVIAQTGIIGMICLTKRPCKPVPTGSSLTVAATAVYVYQNIILIFA